MSSVFPLWIDSALTQSVVLCVEMREDTQEQVALLALSFLGQLFTLGSDLFLGIAKFFRTMNYARNYTRSGLLVQFGNSLDTLELTGLVLASHKTAQGNGLFMP